MRDRVPTKPNRYAVYDDNHNFVRYEYHERADEPTEAGTPLTKATLLSDTTAAQLGLSGNPTVDEALRMRFCLAINFDRLFSGFFSGKTFTVEGGDFAYSGTVPAGLAVIVAVPYPNTTYTVTCEGYSKTVTTTEYFGIYSLTVEAISSTFANNTWAHIATVAEAGNASSYWQVGAEKDITLTGGEVLTLQIYGFNHDDKAGGGKAGITFGLKNLMADTRQMNSSGGNVNGFTGSDMYTWLQGDLYNSLPSDLKSLIKSVNKKTSAGNQSTTINTNAMKIFLYSEVECFGTASFSAAGEGSQYPIFTDAASRIKNLANGSGDANTWWERSPSTSITTSFCNVNSSGDANNNNASTSRGVCFGFCL